MLTFCRLFSQAHTQCIHGKGKDILNETSEPPVNNTFFAILLINDSTI